MSHANIPAFALLRRRQLPLNFAQMSKCLCQSAIRRRLVSDWKLFCWFIHVRLSCLLTLRCTYCISANPWISLEFQVTQVPVPVWCVTPKARNRFPVRQFRKVRSRVSSAYASSLYSVAEVVLKRSQPCRLIPSPGPEHHCSTQTGSKRHSEDSANGKSSKVLRQSSH